MKILLVHNAYHYNGGEDVVFQQEKALLQSMGHEILSYERSNNEIQDSSLWKRTQMVRDVLWSERTRTEVLNILQQQRPDIVHVHNTFVVISPSVYWACHKTGVPVVQTLHNFRWFCPSGAFLRNGRICQECVEHNLWRSVRYGCYRSSRSQTAIVAATLAVHRRMHTWTEMVDCYVVLSDFSRKKLAACGLPANKMFVKPNFVQPDPGPRSGPGDYVVFAGRLLAEKGPLTLLEAWLRLNNDIPLVICGEGPLQDTMRHYVNCKGVRNVRFRGQLSREDTIAAIKNARFVVLPSECFENCPMTVLEAYACGVPVIASHTGALAELVADTGSGLTFRTGDATDLAGKVEWAWKHPEWTVKTGEQARRTFESHYTASANYRQLMSIYKRALQD